MPKGLKVTNIVIVEVFVVISELYLVLRPKKFDLWLISLWVLVLDSDVLMFKFGYTVKRRWRAGLES